ncbi:MAG TPA: SDR family oxidoreductase [Actinomycetota bacterium]|nr:SDR family oxidoreductase [Actinomycetota bacterium]
MGLPDPPRLGEAALPEGTFASSVALVTGGGTGLGKAIAVEFARLGAAVAVVSRSPEHLAAGQQAVEGVGARGFSIACDIRDPEQVTAAFDAVTETLGPPDVLVNNAAGNFPVPAEDLSPNGWRAVVGIVLDGTFHCSREFGRRHLAARSAAAIVNVGASYSWTAGPGFVHSAAAKAGVKSMTETLAVEWAPYGIRVNCLVPGLMPHDDEVAHIKSVPGRGADEAASVPAMRIGYPRELGWAATFLASPYASYISGATLVVDGANWLRRSLLQPEYRSVREQMGKDPFPEG